MNNEQLINEMKPIVERAGAEILKIYESDFDVQTKADQSPLTQADLNAHEVIVGELAALTPEIPIISEESEPPSFEVRSTWSRYWLVDPLDGTKEFIDGVPEFGQAERLGEEHQVREALHGLGHILGHVA